MATETIHLLHTNDMHSHIENWPRILRFLLQKKQAYQQSYTFDIGDAIDRLNPLTDATMGQANVQLMNGVHYDGVTIGNNEGLVLSHDAMNHLYDHANFDVLLANLTEMPKDNQPTWAKPYKIVTTDLGTKLAIIGMTAPYELTYPSLDWQPHEVEDTLNQLLPKLQRITDGIILLSHLGLPTDEDIAKKYDIDVIIGAHTHHLLEHGKLVNGTLLAGAGRYGEHIGDITLKLNQHKIIEKTAMTVPTYELAEESGDYELIRSWLAYGRDALSAQKVAVLPRSITTDEQVYDGLRALKQYFSVPVSMLSTGMFVEDLPEGELNRYDLLESMPHAINPMVITLTGAEIYTLFAEIDKQQQRLSSLALKGSGFRGKIFGYMRFDGIDRQRDHKILYLGQEIQQQRHYQIATLDHYKWVPFFPVIQDVPAKISLDILLRELMANYYEKKYNARK